MLCAECIYISIFKYVYEIIIIIIIIPYAELYLVADQFADTIFNHIVLT